MSAVSLPHRRCGRERKEPIFRRKRARMPRESGPEHSVEPEGQPWDGIGKDRRRADAQLGRDDFIVATAVVANSRGVRDRGAGGRRVVNDAAPANRCFNAWVDVVENDTTLAGKWWKRPRVANRDVIYRCGVGNVDQRFRRGDRNLCEARRAVAAVPNV